MNAARRNYRSRTPCGPHPPASARRLVLRAAFTPGATTTGAPGAARRPQRDQSQQLQDLIKEVVETAVSTGPRGVMRSLQAAQVVAQLVGEYAAAGRVDPPQVVLRKLFERLGVTFIKLGQFIASTPSLFPPEYVDEFQACLDRAEPLPYSVIRDILRADLPQPIEAVFSSIDERPLASASIAQVHAAVLAGSGKEVVIKVVKPGTADIITADLNAVYLATRLLEFAQPELQRLSLAPILSQLRASMREETNLLNEAQHLATFSDFLDRRGLRGVATCPAVYRQYSSKRVLVMERLRGVALTDLDAIRRVTTRDPESVLISALNVWGASVLGAETFHADVHAGNLLVLPDGRVGFIDFGIVGRISEGTWRGLEALLVSVGAQDYGTMARALGAMGATEPDVDYDAFARDLADFFAGLDQLQGSLVVAAAPGGGGVAGGAPGGIPGAGGVAASLEIDQAAVNRLALEMVRIGESHGVRFPPDFGLLLKQSLYFDRYVRALAPGLQVLSDDRVQWRGGGGGGGMGGGGGTGGGSGTGAGGTGGGGGAAFAG